MACSLSTIQAAACLSGIGKQTDRIKLLQWIAQLTCEAGQASVNSALFSGAIIMWSGTIATIPSGWALCNGSNGTPDLRNRFVVCADADSGGVAKSTVVGAAAQTGGSISHTHSDSFGATGVLAAGTAIIAAGAGSYLPNVNITMNGTVQGTTTVPSFYALAYIMKL